MFSIGRIRRSSFGFRLALFSGVTFFVSTCVLFVIAGWIATETIYQTLTDALGEEAAQLATLDSSDAIVTEINRQEASLRGRYLFLFVGSDGQRLAGSLPEDTPFELGVIDVDWPGDAPRLGAHTSDDAWERLIGVGTVLGDGRQLVVAADGESIVEAQEAIMDAGLWGLPLAALIGFGSAVAVGSQYLRRVNAVAAAADAIAGDQLTVRMPKDGSGDEIDRLAGALNSMLDRLAASMESLRQISNDIAHELRTPLSRLRQTLDQAVVKRERGELVRAIGEASDEAKDLLDIFAALLRIAQIEGGALQASFRPVDLSELLQRLCDVYSAVAEDQGHVLDCELSPAVQVRGDQDLLLQLFSNLIENALRHTAAGSRITVRLGRMGPSTVASVSDSGQGIPPEEREKVLQRFYRLDRSRTTPGSGLGLALVSAIAEAHHAEVRLGDADPGLEVQVRFG